MTTISTLGFRSQAAIADYSATRQFRSPLRKLGAYALGKGQQGCHAYVPCRQGQLPARQPGFYPTQRGLFSSGFEFPAQLDLAAAYSQTGRWRKAISTGPRPDLLASQDFSANLRQASITGHPWSAESEAGDEY